MKIIEKLTPVLKSKGWTLSKDLLALVSPTGDRFVLDGTKLIKESGLQTRKTVEKGTEKLRKIEELKTKELKNKIFKFEKDAEKFKKDTGLDFSLSNWKNLVSGYTLPEEHLLIYMLDAFPRFVDTYKKIKGDKLIREGSKWRGVFESPISPVSKVIGWDNNIRDLDGNIGAMAYIIANSPQARNKVFWDGILLSQGVPNTKKVGNTIVNAKLNFINGDLNFIKWFNSNIAGSPAYSGALGLRYYALPIKPSIINPNFLNEISLIKRLTAHPTSNSWNGQPNSPIHSFLEVVPNTKLYRSEGSLKDDLASKLMGRDINGVFTILLEDAPVKALFGGTGMFETNTIENLLKPFRKNGGKL